MPQIQSENTRASSVLQVQPANQSLHPTAAAYGFSEFTSHQRPPRVSRFVSGARDGMEREFVSYAYQDLPRKKIKKYAAQYEGVDMATLIGADEDNFPFLSSATTRMVAMKTRVRFK